MKSGSLWPTAVVLILLLLVEFSLFPVAVSHAYHHNEAAIRWREYGAGAFEESERTGKPIFMLITAIWCYNCHIYWEKSLQTKEVSAYINENYIPVFVDYDRRKDVARSYPAGGIPVTVIIAPTGEPLISVPGYIEKEVLLGNLRKTVAYVKEEFKPEAKEEQNVAKGRGITLPSAQGLKNFVDAHDSIFRAAYDRSFGGFGEAEKQVFAERWIRLLETYDKDRDREKLAMFTKTAGMMLGGEKKSAGKRPSFKDLVSLREREKTALEEVDRLQAEDRISGVFDPIEGGFWRYATKRDWSTPHYEKMLMENAQMIDLMLKGYLTTKDERYKKAARKSCDYVLKTLYDEKIGGFYGSQDADEVYYHMTEEERGKVTPPRVDLTVYTASNSRMAISLLNAGDNLKERRYTEAAVRSINFMEKSMISQDGALSYFDHEKKKGVINGQLEDNAWLILALLKAHEATKENRYIEKAESLIKYSVERLYDGKNGGFYERNSTSREFYRKDELRLENKQYEHNGVMTMALLKAAAITGKKEYRTRAEETMGYFIAEFAYGALTDVDPYLHRVAVQILNEGKKR